MVIAIKGDVAGEMEGGGVCWVDGPADKKRISENVDKGWELCYFFLQFLEFLASK